MILFRKWKSCESRISWMGLVVIIFFIISMFLGINVNAAYTGIMMDENFEAMDTNGPPTLVDAATTEGWTTYIKSSGGTVYGSVLVRPENGNPSNKVVELNRFSSTSTTARVHLSYVKPGGFPGRYMELDYRFKRSPADQSGYKETISIGGNTSVEPDESAYIAMYHTGMTYGDAVSNSEQPIPNAPTLSAETWYHARFIIDQQNRTFNFYLDTKPITTSTIPLLVGKSYYKPTSVPIPIKYIRYSVYRDGSNGSYKGGSVCLDDFRLKALNVWDRGTATFAESFEDMNVTAVPFPQRENNTNKGWSWYAGPVDNATQYGNLFVDYDQCNNKAIKLNRNTSGSGLMTVDYLDPNGFVSSDGRYATVQFRIKPNNNTMSNQQECFAVSGDATDLTKDSVYIFLMGGVVKYANSSGEITRSGWPNATTIVSGNLPIIKAGNWYGVKVVVDTLNRTYDFYMDYGQVTPNTLPSLTGASLYNLQQTPSVPKVVKYMVALNVNSTTTYLDDLLINPETNTTSDIIFEGDNNNSSLVGNSYVDVSVNAIKYISRNSIKAKLICVLYNEQGQVVSINTEECPDTNSLTQKITKRVNLDSIVDLSGYQLKAFLWEDMTNIVPLGNDGQME